MPKFTPLVKVHITLEPDPQAVMKDYQQLLQGFPVLLGDTVQAVYTDLMPQFENTVRFEPPMRVFPQDYPIVWSDDPAKAPRVRAAAMKKIRAAGGPPYPRTKQLLTAWLTALDRAGSTTTIRVSNTHPAARWVFGDFSNNAEKVQQPMHRGRWTLARNAVDAWFNDIADEVVLRVNAEVQKRAKASVRTIKVFGGKP
jgi:hypothetical protein